MGFVAKNKKTGEEVVIFKYDKPREQIVRADIECHLCSGELIIKAGPKNANHFAHKPSSPCSCDYERHGESYEHRFFKQLLFERLSGEYEEYLNATPRLEYPVHEVKRIADIMFTFPSGWMVAHEVQLSKISIEELEARTNDYQNAGIEVVWWLGNNADTQSNRKWIQDNFGQCFTLDWETVHRDKTSNS